MDAQKEIEEVVKQYGQEVVQQIAEFLSVLQKDRPELFTNGVLVDGWVEKLREKPLPVEVLPVPVQRPDVVMPVVDFTIVMQRLQEFGGNVSAVIGKITAFLLSLKAQRPDLFEDGRLVKDWVVRLQSAPLPPQILPELDPVPVNEPTLRELMRLEIARTRRAIDALSVLVDSVPN